jgi:hypothetical protein
MSVIGLISSSLNFPENRRFEFDAADVTSLIVYRTCMMAFPRGGLSEH